MTTTTITHRVLLDVETLVERAHAAALIVEGLRGKDGWKDDGDLARRRAAKRLAFMRWAVEAGEISDG